MRSVRKHSSDALDRANDAREEARIAAVLKCGMLDTPPEPAFDAITALAAEQCEAPVALITLLDRDRQWFKARVGIDLDGTPRELAFCDHAIVQDTPLVVLDMHRDARFAQHPLVVGGPRARFYAGVPLEMSDGNRLGTICVLDTAPRTAFAPRMLSLLQGLARQIVTEFELRATLRDLAEANRAWIEVKRDQQLAFDLSPQIPWTAELDGRIISAGPRWTQVTGLALHQTLGHAWVQALHPADLTPTIAAWQRAVETGALLDLRYRLRTGGTFRWFRARAARALDAEGRPLRWYGLLEDIDAQVAAETLNRQSNLRFQLAVESTNLGICDLDYDTGANSWSREFRGIIGVGEDAVADPDVYLAQVDSVERRALRRMILRARWQPAGATIEHLHRIRRVCDGAERWIVMRGLRAQDSRPGGNRLLLTFRDITDQYTASERLRWAAEHDSLTGLGNRLLFKRELDRAIAAATHGRGRAAVILCDVDGLKETNDTLGHDAGDALLRTFALRLLESVPPTAVVARLGGDEIAVLVEGAGPADASAIAAGIQRELAKPWSLGSQTREIRGSIGLALFPDDGVEPEALLKAADVALYQAKGNGGSSVARYQPMMLEAVSERARMRSDARRALDEERVTPFYQAQIDLETGATVGFEALMRWRDDDGRLRFPHDVAAALADPMLGEAIDRRMKRQVIADLRAWRARGIAPGRVALNACAGDFRDGRFAERFLQDVEDAGLTADCFEIEVTETVFVGRGAERVERALRQLRTAGVRIALDDFGTGFASLSHLRRFPVDVLKIDRSFICGLPTAGEDAEIVRAIINLATSLSVEVVAEGIETQAQVAFLREAGCRTGQGFYFAEAVAAPFG